MLRGGWLCVCLLLYCNIFRAEDHIPMVFTEKPQPHPRYLKEFFPFVLKEERGEAMKPLLAGLKRTSDSNYASDEEIHQGSLISYVEKVAPRVARDENVEGKSQESFVAKTVKDPTQSNPSKTKNITKSEKTWSPTHKSKTTSKLVKSYHPSPAPHTKRPTGTKKVKKRTENVNKRAMAHPKAHDVLEKRSGTLMKTEVRDNVNQLLDEKKMDMRSVVSQPIYFQMRDAIKPTIVPSNPNRLSFDMAMTTMKSRSLMASKPQGMYNDASNRKRSIGMDLNEVDLEKMEKIVSKREVRHKPKKSVKSIITKILIIPVERQIEEGGEEVPEEIDVVSLKHSRDGKKRKKQRKGSSTALSPRATIMTASFVAPDLNRRPTASCGATTAHEKSTTCPAPIIVQEPTKQCTTTSPATTCAPSFIKSSSCRPSTYPTTKPTTRKKITTGLVECTTDSTTEMSSTMISLSVSIALSKGSDSNITTCATDEKTESELMSECLTTTTECPV